MDGRADRADRRDPRPHEDPERLPFPPALPRGSGRCCRAGRRPRRLHVGQPHDAVGRHPGRRDVGAAWCCVSLGDAAPGAVARSWARGTDRCFDPPPRVRWHLSARRQSRTTPHLLELRTSGDLLSEQRRLNSVEETFKPAHQLRLSDAQLGFAGVLSSVKGREMRSSSSTSSGASPSSSSAIERRWISFRRARPASSRGALRTSSNNCLIIVPIRITLPGCSTSSVIGGWPPSNSVRSPASRRPACRRVRR